MMSEDGDLMSVEMLTVTGTAVKVAMVEVLADLDRRTRLR